mmetsp:Transcript_11207/g.12853  ORF Transcript_11207/g.12853 Transcript_11207/m.12853 type:complete len:314 (-) Transcript_11207:1490-2431(-)|eukprot:CAMPEP_0184033086 /NCGR_PEP_ID=MMETSP0955-20130417/3516_1 /TAXON_ID=627963 /ORGANISM="Aplanochytrium sp, Strain PBS07" /LENGTH=313 /DNA_ID=CAMNT_0026319359 /DNA_START=96 /DNA_END=1037 /DNA_ORIENTATION=+
MENTASSYSSTQRVLKLSRHLVGIQPLNCFGSRKEKLDILSNLFINAWLNKPKAEQELSTLLADTKDLSLDEALQVMSGIFSADKQCFKVLEGLAGYKLGWKNAFSEKHALYAPVFQKGLLLSSDNISLSQHHIFSAEAEFGFVLKSEIVPRRERYSEEEVWQNIKHMVLCIELCGARQTESLEAEHYVADGLLGSCIVKSHPMMLPDSPDVFTKSAVKLIIAGKVINTGTAKNNPCDSPLASLTYLVNDRCVGEQLNIAKDSLVITGHCCQAGFANRPAPPFVNIPLGEWQNGDTVIAEFSGFGNVSVTLAK